LSGDLGFAQIAEFVAADRKTAPVRCRSAGKDCRALIAQRRVSIRGKYERQNLSLVRASGIRST